MQLALRTALIVTGLANVAWGLFALTLPDRAAELLEFGLTSPEGRGEVRATYGGLILGLGVGQLISLGRPDGRASLRLLAIVFGGLSLGRLASLPLDGFSTYTAGVAGLELAFTVLLAVGSVRLEPRVGA